MQIFVKTLTGLQDLQFSAPEDVTVDEVVASTLERLPPSLAKAAYISFQNGSLLPRKRGGDPIKAVVGQDAEFVLLRLNACLCGGKGGFGSQLKSQGGRMSRRKGKKRESDKDGFRNLDGRSMKSVRQAKELAAYLENLPAQERLAAENKRAKLQAIIDRANRAAEAGTSNVKFDDTQYLEESEALLRDVRMAAEKAGVTINDDDEGTEGEDDSDEHSDSETNSGNDSKGSSLPSGSSLSSSVSSASSLTPSTQARQPKAANFFGDEEDVSESE